MDVDQNGKLRSYSWGLLSWERDRSYYVADGLDPEDIAGEYSHGRFVLRLRLDGELVCEDAPREIRPGD
jgi:hypothetical protein